MRADGDGSRDPEPDALQVSLGHVAPSVTSHIGPDTAQQRRRIIKSTRGGALALWAAVAVAGAALIEPLVEADAARGDLVSCHDGVCVRLAPAAAVTLQAGWRGVSCRVELGVQHMAATIIQAAARALPCRLALA